MTGEFWVGLGLGYLAGAVIFDQAWRHLRRLESKLAELAKKTDE
jgi:hypothetical protein